jgi:hypothetical protein
MPPPFLYCCPNTVEQEVLGSASRPAPHVCMSMPDQRTPRRKNFFTAIMLLVVIGEGTLLVMAVLAVLGVI